jgi:hypothetical protein
MLVLACAARSRPCFSTRGRVGGESRLGGEAVRVRDRGLYGCEAQDGDGMLFSQRR